MERGLLRYVILSVLKDGPKHGYEIMRQLEEKTQGRYSPSPGTLYPTLQLLEDQELVKAEQEADKRVYHLTDDGHAELDKQNNLVEGFWSRFQDRTPSAMRHEMRFATDALKDLIRTSGGAFRSSASTGDTETVRKVRQALERCENEIREIMTQSAGAAQTANTGERADDEIEEVYL
jgi:DNA-binding PadR family transcriptional regulator